MSNPVDRIRELIAGGESLTVEFKSDQLKQINDQDIYEVVVCLANCEGGTLLIGVEDDGTVTGSRHRHETVTDPARFQSAIFNNTIPNQSTRIQVIDLSGLPVIAIDIDPCSEPCATSRGSSFRRALGQNGKPECPPYYPRDQHIRRVDQGLMDYTAQVIEGVTFADLNPLEFERVRQAIQRLDGDRRLLGLSNDELAGALQLVESKSGSPVPNIAGMLMLGHDHIIRKHLPTHGVFFQVLDAKGDVKVNDSLNGPLLRTAEELEERFKARNQEQEIQVGMIRVPIPDYSFEAYREAISNALLHRNYGILQATHVQWQPDHLLITSPGGFPPGITTANFLVHEPKPRNHALFEAARSIGLVERTGRGIDRIFHGQARYGRPMPDYSRTDETGVRLVLPGGEASLQFAAFVHEQEQTQKPLTLSEILLLNAVFFERRLNAEEAASLIQKGMPAAKSVLGNLEERGFIEGRGAKTKTYTLSAAFYRKLGQPAGYVRAQGVSRLRHEAMVLEYVEAHGKLERQHVMELCQLTGDQSSRLLKRMCEKGKLIMRGKPPGGSFYVLDKP